jgi:hypothetical protein
MAVPLNWGRLLTKAYNSGCSPTIAAGSQAGAPLMELRAIRFRSEWSGCRACAGRPQLLRLLTQELTPESNR